MLRRRSGIDGNAVDAGNGQLRKLLLKGRNFGTLGKTRRRENPVDSRALFVANFRPGWWNQLSSPITGAD